MCNDKEKVFEEMLAALKCVERWQRGYGTKTSGEMLREYIDPAIAKAEARMALEQESNT